MERAMRKLRRLRPVALLILAMAGAAAVAVANQAAASASQPSTESNLGRGDWAKPSLAVMSYNVEGLPAPVRFGRAASLARIGQRLALMRSEKREPNIVMLQEAFAAP